MRFGDPELTFDTACGLCRASNPQPFGVIRGRLERSNLLNLARTQRWCHHTKPPNRSIIGGLAELSTQ